MDLRYRYHAALSTDAWSGSTIYRLRKAMDDSFSCATRSRSAIHGVFVLATVEISNIRLKRSDYSCGVIIQLERDWD